MSNENCVEKFLFARAGQISHRNDRVPGTSFGGGAASFVAGSFSAAVVVDILRYFIVHYHCGSFQYFGLDEEGRLLDSDDEGKHFFFAVFTIKSLIDDRRM